jgi:hypothetical protein
VSQRQAKRARKRKPDPVREEIPPASRYWSTFGPLVRHRPQKDFMGRVVFLMTGYISIRLCGCALMLGTRSDTGTYAMSAQSCTHHVDELKIAQQMLRDRDPAEQKEHPARTFQRLLDEAIAGRERVDHGIFV